MSDCTCIPCITSGRGPTGLEHCAACCFGLLIEEYDHDCPIAEHRTWAERQFPILQAGSWGNMAGTDTDL